MRRDQEQRRGIRLAPRIVGSALFLVVALVASTTTSCSGPKAPSSSERSDAIQDAFERAVTSGGRLSDHQRALIDQVRPSPDCPLGGDRSPVASPNSQVEIEVVTIRDSCLTFRYETVESSQLQRRISEVEAEPQVVTVSPMILELVTNQAGPVQGYDENLQWALNTLGFPRPGQPPWPTGEGTSVAVIDSGIDSKHPDLVGRVDLTGCPDKPTCDRLETPSDKEGDWKGHGTAVAGVIASSGKASGVYGLAPNIRLLDAAAFQPPSLLPTRSVGKSITWAVNHGADVINISVNIDIDREKLPPVTGDWFINWATKSIESALELAHDNGVPVVVAGGNCGDPKRLLPMCHGKINLKAYPASSPSAAILAVAATNDQDEKASFSTEQNYIDIAAPGENIVSLKRNSGVSKKEDGDGTSLSAPFVAAAAALLIGVGRSPTVPLGTERAERVALADRVRKALLGSTANRPKNKDGRDDRVGAGRLDIQAALRSLGWNPAADPEVLLKERMAVCGIQSVDRVGNPVPFAVRKTAADLCEAAKGRDFAYLARLASAYPDFETRAGFPGGDHEAYWRASDARGEDPLGVLIRLLGGPINYRETRGRYEWPIPCVSPECHYGSYIYISSDQSSDPRGTFDGVWLLYILEPTTQPTPVVTTAPPVVTTPPTTKTPAVAPTNVILNVRIERLQLEWDCVPGDAEGFEVDNGETSRIVTSGCDGRGFYNWYLDGPEYMCFRVRAFNSGGTSEWVPLGYICGTAEPTPP